MLKTKLRVFLKQKKQRFIVNQQMQAMCMGVERNQENS